MDGYDFFIAHARRDYEHAKKLAEFLRARGYKVFVAKADLHPTDPWPRKIPDAQDQSKVTVALLSQPYDATYVEEEIARANQLAKSGHKLAAAYLDGIPERAPYGLQRLPPLDAREEGLEQIAQRLSLDDTGQPSTSNTQRPSPIGTAEALIRQDAKVQSFAEQFLDSPRLSLPFGGRHVELQYLERWLANGSASPYLLLSGPAGRGKSALLSRWSHELEQRGERVVFFPVSLTYETSFARVALPAIATRLANMLGVQVPLALNDPSERWREFIQLLLRKPLGDQRLLVILDGADEASDWKADFFPELPADGLRVVVSARPDQQRKNEHAWLHALRWTRQGLAEILPLPLLSLEELREALTRADQASLGLGDRSELAQELFRLTQGDPLLLHLYLVWFREQHARGMPLTMEPLRAQASGLAALLEQWKEQQERWLQAQPGAKPPAATLQLVLDLFACALGPIPREELEPFAHEHAGLEPEMLDTVLRALPRFVGPIGQEGGLAFVHPAIRRAFLERMSRERRVQAIMRFVAWSQAVLTKLTEHKLAPARVPSYLVKHCAAHLLLLNKFTQPEQMVPLLSGEWRATWDLHGGDSGFLSDVYRIWQHASRANRKPWTVLIGHPWLSVEIRCALCFASRSSLVYSVPPEVLWALVESRKWTLQRALRHAQSSQNTHARVRMSVALAPFMEKEKAQALLSEALAWVLNDASVPVVQAGNLAILAPHLPLAQSQQSAALLIEGLFREDPFLHLEELLELAPWMPSDLASRLAERATRRDAQLVSIMELLAQPQASEAGLTRLIQLLRDCVGWRESRMKALLQYLQRASGSLPTAVASATLDAIEEGSDFDVFAWRGLGLAGLMPHLDAKLRARAFKIAYGIENKLSRLVAVATLTDPSDKVASDALVHEWLDWARALDKRSRPLALAALVPHLRGRAKHELALEALQTANKAPLIRETVFERLKRDLPPVALDALRLFSSIGDEAEQALLYVSLASGARGQRKQHLLEEALSRARRVQRPSWRAQALWKVAAALPERSAKEVRAEALDDLAQSAGDMVSCANNLAEHASTAARKELALFLQRRILSGDKAAGYSLLLSPHLLKIIGKRQVRQYFDAQEQTSMGSDATVLRNVEPFLAPIQIKAHFDQIYAEATEDPTAFARTDTLLDLAHTQYGRNQSGLLNEALEAALGKLDDPNVEMSVASLVSSLSRKKIQQWLARLEEGDIDWPYARASLQCRLLDQREPNSQAIDAILLGMARCGLDYMRLRLLEQLAPYLQASTRPYHHFHQVLFILSERPRETLLEALAILRPFWSRLMAVESEPAESAISDATRSWP